MGESRGLTVTLETVTPLFLGGAEPRGAPELRAPPFRGALRYWWRALVGGVIGPDWRKIKKKEDELWGSTKGTGAVIVKLPSQPSPSTGPFRPLLHRDDRRGQFTYRGIKPLESFAITLSPRPGQTCIPDTALASFILLVTLGGLGKRSRRGFGTLRIKNVTLGQGLKLPETLNLLLEKHPTDIVQLAEHVQNVITVTHSIAVNSGQRQASIPQSSIPSFPILAEPYAKILLCRKKFDDWEEAMVSFWRKLRSHSYRDNLVFGKERPRQASPLHLRIARAGKEYYLLMTGMRSRFKKTQPDWSLMERFLIECADDWEGVFLVGGEMQW